MLNIKKNFINCIGEKRIRIEINFSKIFFKELILNIFNKIFLIMVL